MIYIVSIILNYYYVEMYMKIFSVVQNDILIYHIIFSRIKWNTFTCVK